MTSIILQELLQQYIDDDLEINAPIYKNMLKNPTYTKDLTALSEYLRTDTQGNRGSRVIPANVADFLSVNIDYRFGNGAFYILKRGQYVKDADGFMTQRIVSNVIPPDDRNRFVIEDAIYQLKTHARPLEDPSAAAATYREPRSFLDLYNSDVQPPLFAVDGMIPEGLTLIAAPPKWGKSWLMLDLCFAVAEGTPFLGRETREGTSLYLDFESGDSAIKQRLTVAAGHTDIPPKAKYKTIEDIAIDGNFPRIGSGFEDFLEAEIRHDKDLKLIVIDTLHFVRSPHVRSGNQYNEEYRDCNALHQIGMKHHVAIVAVTHTTQMKHPEDVFSEITGTNGLTGAADANMVIAKEKRTDKTAVLAVAGRHARELTLSIELDRDNMTWISHGEVKEDQWNEEQSMLQEYESSDVRAAVLKIAQSIEKPFTGEANKIREEAVNLGVPLTEQPKTIGLFLKKHQGMFLKHDSVQVTSRSNGNAGRIWVIKPVWTEAAAEGEENADASPFT